MYTTLTDLITISTTTILLRSPNKGFKASAVIPLTHLLWIFLSKLYPAPCIYLEFTMKKSKATRTSSAVRVRLLPAVYLINFH